MEMKREGSRLFSALVATAVITTSFIGSVSYTKADTMVNSAPAMTQTVNAATAISIANARTTAVGTTVTVQGVVTYINGGQIFIQDGTAGICIYKKGVTASVGDQVTATGALSNYGTAPKILLELVPAATTDVVVASHGNSPVIPTVAIGNLNSNYQSEFVKIANVKISSVAAGQSAMLTDTATSKQISIFKVPAGVTGVNAGDMADVVGMYTQMGDLSVVNGTDIKPAGSVGPIVKHPMPISQARSCAKGTAVTVTGVVTYVSGGQCFIQDDEAGICIYKQGMNVSAGDKIEVTGVTDEFISNSDSLIEVVPGSATAPYVNILSSGNTVSYPEVNVSDLGSSFQSMFVKIINATIDTVAANAQATLTDKADPTKTVKIYKVPAGVTGVNSGDSVAVTGLYTQHNDLTVVNPGDIVKAN